METGIDQYTKEELEEAVRSLSSLISKCEKAQEKLLQSPSQLTLLKRRVKAFKISQSLIKKELEE